MRAGAGGPVAGDVEGAVVAPQEGEPSGTSTVGAALDRHVPPPAVVFNRWWRLHSGARLPEQVGPWGPCGVMWSQRVVSPAPAASRGVGAEGEDTGCRSTKADASVIRSGTSYGVDVHVVVEVDDGVHDDLGVGVGASGPDLLDGDQRPRVLQPAQFARDRASMIAASERWAIAPPDAPSAAARRASV